ncbi:glycoside hydrolase family 16 protein [Pedobacter sp. PLR]|uniref:glycoside hydrolase family 16 protein n=1 Tax=Pedobacter sp. PLR TaxID=2994465 RepID=UPI0022479009|nr:glycoside hydrolase family 16 protein [Pedobacter sp. PLR]MCX2449777.1 glycoside hydrolase family 16 protein [Pedobacter sp. PLR]
MNKYLLLICCPAILLASCSVLPYRKADNYIYLQKEKTGNPNWKLIWEDDFNGAVIDSSKWSKIPKGTADWNKHMSSDPSCYAQSDGKLYLKGIKNPDTLTDSRPFLTGGLYTRGKFAFQYGKIEIHAKLECAAGAWPAMWMLAEKNKYGKYPNNGEIDIMEHLNRDSIIYQTTHSHYTLNLKQKDNPPHGGTAKININTYNTFGLEWYPDRLVFTLNGVETFRYPRVTGVDASQWPYDQPFYVMIDQQLGGSWVGKVNQDQLPVQMIVDWVKVYQY